MCTTFSTIIALCVLTSAAVLSEKRIDFEATFTQLALLADAEVIHERELQLTVGRHVPVEHEQDHTGVNSHIPPDATNH